ncbi:hypothetical protein BD289DRAFT_136467 [Coniella lustricola]|uniref:Quinon protein alcohol dehydrogenase-like superfamily n=1 Tax=Coniella lustricola TaxID=2025994 RepID=A0A2T3AFG8_9PEZI|nr:hypothetical protein BD289DRAFT_136467 [Coniella lustricola]
MILRRLSSFLPLLAVHATPAPSSPGSNADVQLLFSLPGNDTWLENLAYRASTNAILATRLDIPQIWSIDATSGSGTLLANVSTIGALAGIAQLGLSSSFGSSTTSNGNSNEDFLIAGLNFSALTGLQPNSSAFWKLSFEQSNASSSLFTIQEAFTVPGIGLVNGLATWNASMILAADSAMGAIWRIDVHTGDAAIVLQDPTMKPVSSIGVNGVKVFRSSPASTDCSLCHQSRAAATAATARAETKIANTTTDTAYIYYTSTEQSLLARIAVDPVTATPLGPAQILASGLGEADDFTLVVEDQAQEQEQEQEDEDGCTHNTSSEVTAVLLATGRNNSIVLVGLDGNVVTVAGGSSNSNSSESLALAGATACHFGSASTGSASRLFVTTAGGAESDGLVEAPGRLVAVELF